MNDKGEYPSTLFYPLGPKSEPGKNEKSIQAMPPRIRPITSRIPEVNVIDQIPSRTIIDIIPPPVVSRPEMAQPIVDIPSFDPPQYNPPTLNPVPVISDPQFPGYRPPASSEGEEEEERELSLPTPETPVVAPPPRPVIEVPFVGIVPLPYGREVALAGTTAIGATAAALLGKSIVEWLVKKFKPIVKKMMLKIKEKSGKQFTDYELQLFFDFENRIPEQKSVAKRLEKEKKAEKARQLEEHLQRQRQRKR